MVRAGNRRQKSPRKPHPPGVRPNAPPLRLGPADSLMSIAPPENQNPDTEHHHSDPDPPRRDVDQVGDAKQLVTHQVADRNDDEAPDQRTGNVPPEKPPERHARGARHRT